MPPKGSSKAVSKKCPECKKFIPVATRVCHCGHQFFEERRKSTASNASEHDDEVGDVSGLADGKRRSERVKREKPNFYDALEYDNQMRKARKERLRDDQINPQRIKRERKVRVHSDMEDEDDDEPIKEKKKRKKKNNGEKKDEEEDEEIMTGLSLEKEREFSIVLADINFKLGLNNPAFMHI